LHSAVRGKHLTAFIPLSVLSLANLKYFKKNCQSIREAIYDLTSVKSRSEELQGKHLTAFIPLSVLSLANLKHFKKNCQFIREAIYDLTSVNEQI
jgi:queuine/archaeosine tRNA-ribosyltransferase